MSGGGVEGTSGGSCCWGNAGDCAAATAVLGEFTAGGVGVSDSLVTAQKNFRSEYCILFTYRDCKTGGHYVARSRSRNQGSVSLAIAVWESRDQNRTDKKCSLVSSEDQKLK